MKAGRSTNLKRPRTPIRRARMRRTHKQALWTLVSQALSSLSNFGLAIAVARAVDERIGGIFTYVFLIFSLVVGLSRAVTTDPLLIRFSAESDERRNRALSQASASSTGAGLLAGGICLAVGLVLGGELGLALVLLVLVLPGQLLQDSWRNAAFATGAVYKAALNDFIRFIVQFAAIGVLISVGVRELGWYLVAWALGAGVAAAVGIWQFGRPAALTGAISWLHAHRGISIRLGSDYLVNMGGVMLTTTLLAALLGFAATGGLRFAQTLLGPVQMLFGALTAFMIPLLVRRLSGHGPRALRRPALLLSLAAFSVTAGVVVPLILLPDSIGRQLLGASWDEAQQVMPAIGANQSFIALALGGALMLKALGRVDLLFWVTSLQAPLILGLGVGGALLLGIEGAAWGMAMAQFVGLVVVMVMASRATR